jgi:hypothetical protein
LTQKSWKPRSKALKADLLIASGWTNAVWVEAVILEDSFLGESDKLAAVVLPVAAPHLAENAHGESRERKEEES